MKNLILSTLLLVGGFVNGQTFNFGNCDATTDAGSSDRVLTLSIEDGTAVWDNEAFVWNIYTPSSSANITFNSNINGNAFNVLDLGSGSDYGFSWTWLGEGGTPSLTDIPSVSGSGYAELPSVTSTYQAQNDSYNVLVQVDRINKTDASDIQGAVILDYTYFNVIEAKIGNDAQEFYNAGDDVVITLSSEGYNRYAWRSEGSYFVGATVNSGTGSISGSGDNNRLVIENAEAGSYVYYIDAFNSVNGEDTNRGVDVLRFTVVGDLNTAPTAVLNDIPSEDGQVVFSFDASDADGDTLDAEFYINGEPNSNGSVRDFQNGTFRGSLITEIFEGETLVISAVVSDGRGGSTTVSQTFYSELPAEQGLLENESPEGSLSISGVSDGDIIQSTFNNNGYIGVLLDLNASFTDPNDDILNYEWRYNGVDFQSPETSSSFEGQTFLVGTYSVSVRVSDDRGGSVISNEISFTVVDSSAVEYASNVISPNLIASVAGDGEVQIGVNAIDNHIGSEFEIYKGYYIVHTVHNSFAVYHPNINNLFWVFKGDYGTLSGPFSAKNGIDNL